MTDETIRSIASRSEFADAVRDAIARAADRDAMELVLVDPDFADWPLGEVAVVDALTRWARPHRKIVLIGGSFDALARRAPRFVEWRRQWSHVIECRTPDDLDADRVPTLLLAQSVTVVRLDDRLRHRGIVSDRPLEQVEARESVDALLQRSMDAFPATTLGL